LGLQACAYKSPGIPPAAQCAWNKYKEKVLQAFSDAVRSPLDIILDIMDSTQLEYENYVVTSCRFSWIIFLLTRKATTWSCTGCTLVLSTLSAQLSILKWSSSRSSPPSVEQVSSEFINNWTLETVVEPATQLCPSLLCILEAAAETKEAKQKNKIKSPKTVRSTHLFMLLHVKLNLPCSRREDIADVYPGQRSPTYQIKVHV
jgi:hypothetical protein